MQSVSFDCAADFYDASRGFPAGVADQVGAAAMALLKPHARVLEIGVGTGRIAKPLLAHGARVTGVDLSRNMMRKLMDTLPAGLPAPGLIEGDVTRLPLASRSFDGAAAVHVLHLIPDWHAAVAEVRRVLVPGGALLFEGGWRPRESPQQRIRDQYWKYVRQHWDGGTQQGPVGAHDDDVPTTLRRMGAIRTGMVEISWTRSQGVAQELEGIEKRLWSSMWTIPDEAHAQACSHLRDWALREYGSFEHRFDAPDSFVWQRFVWA